MVWLVGLGRLVGLDSERIPENERDWDSWGPYPWNPKPPGPKPTSQTISCYLCQGLNSHYFHIIGDGHQPNSRGLYTHYKDSY